MGRHRNVRWKAVPLRRRVILSVLSVIHLQALLFLLLELPGAGGEVPLGGIVAVAGLLASGAGLVHYIPKWITPSARNDSASPMAGARRGGLVQRVLGTALMLLSAGYLLVLTFPHVLFPHTLSYRGFRVHSDQPLSQDMATVLDRAQARLASSAVYDSTARHTIFLSGNYVKFALFAREHFRAFAIRSPVRGHIFVANADPDRDVAARYAEDRNERRLSGVIAHEVTHNLLEKAAGGHDLPRWKEEGYAEYVAGESTFDRAEGVRLLMQGRSEDSSAFRYLKYSLLVEYLLEEKGVAFEEFLRTPFDPWQLEAEFIRRLQSHD